MKITTGDELKRLRDHLRARQDHKLRVRVCGGTGCRARGSEEVLAGCRAALAEAGADRDIEVIFTGCHGLCERGPLVIAPPQGIFYQRVEPDDARAVITRTVLGGELIERLLPTDPLTGRRITHESELPFYAKQRRITLRLNGLIDPMNIDDYIAWGGYQSLAAVIAARDPLGVIETIERAGLRGRGGAGFPTGKKWRLCRAAPGEIKYVICNGDEGDPGAFMDRSLLEGNPHSVLEGMIIGAYAIGATHGIVYVREEYPLAVKTITTAIAQAREYGFLGSNIFQSGFSFDVEVVRGAGAFVAGEETALIAAVEGRKSEPRQRPPYPVECGLWGKPTVINNVETWATVPVIIEKGAEWYAQIGTETSKGTKIFSLVGKIANTGLVEVPMGMTLREIIYDIGGGMSDGRELKAVQTGGPSGGCIPRELIDLPVDYESLTRAGSMMGSGGMIVMDDRTCMVDVARYFMDFLRDESCGKCLSCREGTQRMYEILNAICEGTATEEDIETLEELAQVVADTSLCGLGQTAPNPVLSTLRYFRSEYEAHVRERRCPAGVCKALIRYHIRPEKCTGCLACIPSCPAGAIAGELKQPHVIDQGKCIKCGICSEVCTFDAIEVV
ncbi:MAG TPA: NADH-quinone oxidoreductase subunit NuoF [Blastocatellia bacterium]|nr:NADH-quinone oxidoreductase subunit NuoF [Blastocatellia bacterium]